MRKEEKASISIMKIICVSIILILISGIGVMAVNTKLNDIKITLQNGYEMTVLTSKTKVSDILEENNIILEENQKTIPDIDSEVKSGQNIQITDKSYNEVQIAKISDESVETSLDQLLQNYAPITEKIVVEQVTIPYETITKNSTSAETNTTTAVIGGETYKITAYCSCSKCCGKTTGRTATGTQATAGRTVAAPSKFAFGTKLNIGGHIYTVEDRGGAIKGNRIDVYFNSHSAALQWGVKYLPVSLAQ